MKVFGTGTLKFGSGASLVIKGTLDAEGTSSQLATFTRSGTSSWNGITIRNGSQAPTASLSYAKVQYCATALDIGTNTAFDIDNCVLSNSAFGVVFTTSGAPIGTQRTIANSTIEDVMTGILFNSFSLVLLDNNTITRSTIPTEDVATGIRCFSSSPKILRTTVQAGGGGGAFVRGVACLNASSPVFEDGTLGGYNRIRNNGTGVYCSDKSKPILGIRGTGDVGGQNSIYGNITYDVTLIDSSKIRGENNWWGENPPDTTDFSVAAGSSLDYTPYLTSDPNPGAGMGGGIILATKERTIDGAGGTLSPGFTPIELSLALSLRTEGRYDEALVSLQAVVASPRIPIWAKEWAVTEMLAAAQNIENSAVSVFLENARSTFPALVKTIDFVLPHVYLDEGLTSEAMSLFDQNISQYPNSELERDGLYGRFLNALYTDEDTASARIWLSTLSTQYPESDEALVADHLMDTYTATLSGPGTVGQRVAKDVTSQSTLVPVPREFSLAQNYPNPFNPTTIIKYDLPTESQVTLKVYDILGREVRTVIDEFEEAGYHQVTLDASNLATGVYFYRLTAGVFTDAKRLLVVK
jgi:hypothetical protein